MTTLRPQLRGLMAKLALFYILLALPTMVVVESGVLIFEFQEFVAGIEQGRLRQAADQGAREVARRWNHVDEAHRPGVVSTWLEAWILRLERPRIGLSEADSYVLMELSRDPLATAVLAPDGRVIAQAPPTASWNARMPSPDEAGFAEAVAGTRAVELTGEESPHLVRRVLAPVRDAGGKLLALVYVELRLPLPWRSFLLKLSFEWPIILIFMVVFGLASSFFFAAWVTRRLERIARAASAWSRGDFSDRIDDRSRDELGVVSGLLDRMALDLRTLMRSRAQLATLAERQRLARDLHDTVKQKAFALNMQLATARRVIGDVHGSEPLAQAQRLTQQIQRELGELLDEMRASDADLPLVERLRSRANDWSHTSGMPVALSLDDLPPLPAPTEEALLRIVDEALSNVLRHSGASGVDIELRREAERVRLSIADNGRGISGGTSVGMGLRNMRDRAQALRSGRFELEARPGGGTRVVVSFLLEGTAR